jgi:serine-type D-Ala-D-Ala carboxypeptidase (penicillin-binding protein 5/6)
MQEDVRAAMFARASKRMNLFRLCRGTLTVAALVVLGLGARPAFAQSFQTSAPFALVEDYESGAVLFDKNADQPMAPASTAQMLTAEIVFNELKQGRLHLDDKFAVSEYAWRTGGAHAHSTATFLDLHSQVRIEDLLRGLIIQSGNDAAITLAEGISGTEDNFASLMNKRAAELGMTNSHFTNPSGKPDPAMRVTAHDMALLADHIIRTYPDYYHYFGEKDFTWNKIHQLNRNPLLTMEFGADGLKTGDTTEGGYGLVGSAVQNDQRLIVVANGSKSAQERAEEARKLFNWGFRSFDPRVLFAPGDAVGTVSVYGGAQGEVPVTIDQPAKLFVPHGSGDRLTAKIVYVGPLVAPVSEGIEVGRLKVWRGSTLALDLPVKTKSAVPLGGLARRALDAGMEFAQNVIRQALAKK